MNDLQPNNSPQTKQKLTSSQQTTAMYVGPTHLPKR